MDINCDLGESYEAFLTGRDNEILDYVTSVNIACGYHAGDHSIMHQTVRHAIRKNVHIGVHTLDILIVKDSDEGIWRLVQQKFTI